MSKAFDLCERLDLSNRLRAITAPALVINGSEGKQVPIDRVREAVASMRDARLRVLQDKPFNVMTTSPEGLRETDARLPARG